MKKFGGKLLSFVLSLCLITAMLPGLPALASTDTTELFAEALSTAAYYDTVADIGDAYKGLVYTYSRTNNQITIDVGLYNVENFSLGDIYFHYDPSTVNWMRTTTSGKRSSAALTLDDAVSRPERAYGSANMDPSIFTDAMKTTLSEDEVEDISVIKFLNDTNYSPFAVEGLTAQITGEAFAGNIYLNMDNTTKLTTSNFSNSKKDAEMDSYPTDGVMPMYSFYFDVIEGTTVDADTFYTFVANSGVKGARLRDNSNGIVAEGSAFVGFPYDVDFSVNDGTTAVNGATVTVYKKGTSTVAGTGTTVDGKATISLVPGEYDYKVTATGFIDGSGTFAAKSVGSTGSGVTGTGVRVALTAQGETEHQVKWVFTDSADSTKKLEGVSIVVSSEGNASVTLTTDENGEESLSFAPDTYTYTASLEGYESHTEEFTLSAPQTFNRTLTKSTTPTFDYEIAVVDAGNNPLVGATVNVYNEAKNKKLATATTNKSGIALVEDLEAGKTYYYTVSNGVMYVDSAMTPFTVSTTAEENKSTTELTKETITGEPTYIVYGTPPAAEGDKYTVTVKLLNVALNGASFGLKYDNEYFTLDTDNIVYNSNLIQQTTTVTENPNAGFAPQPDGTGDGYGYVTFSWDTYIAANTEHVVDARTTEQTLVTYTFTLKDGWEDWVDSETFQVMPWTDTEQGASDLTNAPHLIPDIWNVDEQKYMGLAITQDAEGEWSSVGTPTPIGMTFVYDDMDRHHLTFKVVDSVSSAAIQNATIDLYSSLDQGVNLGPLTTDENGLADKVVDADTYYLYIASAQDYWSNPEPDATEDYNETAVITAPTEITVPLRAMERHDVTANVENGTIIFDADHTVTDATPDDNTSGTETWEKFATNGIDLYFVTAPLAGYTINGTPTYSVDGGDTDVPAAFDAATNQWYVPKDKIVGNVTVNVTYKAGSFTVTANMNAGGTLTWDDGDPATGDPTAGDVFTDTDMPEERTYQMSESSGELLFKATVDETDPENPDTNYEIYQVIINGSDYPIQAGITEFRHEFENIRENHTITVLFKLKGAKNPSDYVVSVLAGEYGKVSVSYGNESDELDGELAKDYIVPRGTTFNATATPDTDYEIDNVFVNGAAEDITDRTTHRVSVLVNADDADVDTQSIVATFRAAGTEDSIQYWIKTEIVGMGKILPFGSRLYYPYETPSFDIEPASRWKTESVVLTMADGSTEDKGTTNKVEFTELTQDVVIKATFTEIMQAFSGVVNYAQGDAPTDPEKILIESTLPKVVFERVEDGATFEASFDGPQTTANLPGNKDSTFTVELPYGTYIIKASKHGHLDYEITGFPVNFDADVPENELPTDATVEGKIVLTPGNTNNDKYITFFDILRVVNGSVRYGDGSADIDETSSVGLDDMNYAKANYAEAAFSGDYEAHKTKAGV